MRRHPHSPSAVRRAVPPTLPRLWLASAVCEAAVALGAAGAFFVTHSTFFR